MSCRIPEIKRRTIEVNIALEKPSKEIAKDVNVSCRSVQRFSNNLRVHGSLSPLKVVSQGWPRTITPEMQEVHLTSLVQVNCSLLWCINTKSLLDYLAAHPSVYIDEQVYYLWDTFVSKSMSNALNACSNAWSGQKRRYYAPGFFDMYFAIFLISRCNYVL